MSGCEDGACKPGAASDDRGQPDGVRPDMGVSASEARRGKDVESSSTAEDGGIVPIEIDVISDTMCPWCWVGKRHMEIALRDCSHLVRASKIEWLPFFLDADLPEEGKPVRDYYRDNYGDPSAGETMQPHLVAAGRKVGLDFESTYGKVARYRPTVRSHRLVELAKRQGRQDEAVEEIFRMYFEGGGRLNSVEDLAGAAERAGVNGAREFLERDECREEVLAEARRVRGMARGVPKFVFRRADRPGGDGPELTFSGGRPPRAFVDVFRQLYQMN